MKRQTMKQQKLKKQRIQKNFLASLCFLALTSITVLLTPFSGDEGIQQMIGYFAGGIFWAGIVIGAILYLRIGWKEREFLNEKVPKGKVPGVLCFFSNVYASIVDAVMIITLILNIYCIRTIKVSRLLELLVLFCFTTSVYLHFLLNGRVFRLMISKNEKGVGKI